MVKKKNFSVVYMLARAGAIAIGVVYAMIGVIALLSLMQLKQGGAGNTGVLHLLSNMPLGEVVVAIVFLGLVAYIIWKFYNAWKDPYGYGSNWKGIGKRLGIAGAGIAYSLIAYTAIQAFLGMTVNRHGRPSEQRNLVAEIFQWGIGEWLIGGLGLIVALTGIAQFVYVIKRAYREKLHYQKISTTKKQVIGTLAWIGHFARGIILLIIAYFLIQAAVLSNPEDVVNTDKAFNFLGEKIGHASFVAVAAGTICYGFYMFALSRYYDFSDDF